jgi:hypothetical protein
MLARRQLWQVLGAATAGLSAAFVLWACSGQVLPPPGESGLEAPPGARPAGPDGGRIPLTYDCTRTPVTQ